MTRQAGHLLALVIILVGLLLAVSILAKAGL